MRAEVEAVWQHLTTVTDPEIPAVNVVEMGIVRDVTLNEDKLEVTITPTYSGCPAMQVIEDDIVATLKEHGFKNIQVKTTYTPAWTTEFLTESAKQKLKASGIAPPCNRCQKSTVPFTNAEEKIACPFCDSTNTQKRSEFGSTACKALYFCNACQQPFDYFKAI